MQVERFIELKELVVEHGFASDIDWAETVGECQSADDFAREHCFVVCNSGLKAQVATGIFRKVWQALQEGRMLDDDVFRNVNKRKAMQYVYDNRERLFEEYLKAEDKVAYLETLPHIGGIIKFHLAKNFGVACCKPDRHLVRIAEGYRTTPDELCARLAAATGFRVNTIDYVIWRCANLGLV